VRTDLRRLARVLTLAVAGCVATVRSAERGLGRKAERHGLVHERRTIAGARLQYWAEPRTDTSPAVVLLHGFGPPGPWQ